METSSIIFFLFLTLFFQVSHSKTILIDGVSEWRNPSVHIGDSLTFKHKYHYKLYIFQNREAFDHCNFTQAILLTKPNSTSFLWNPSRPGFFYFSFNNGSLKSCKENEKFAIRVFPKPPENTTSSPESSPLAAPSPSSGGNIVSSSPASHWHFLSPQASSSPSPTPSAKAPTATIPSVLPATGGIPFINSNPAVPLPTGETDAASIRPLPASSGHRRTKMVAVWIGIQSLLISFLSLLALELLLDS